jgi:hypothetical protein
MTGGASWLTWVAVTGQLHPFRWEKGADRLLLVSVGGGHWTVRETAAEARQRNLLQQAARLPEMLLRDAAREERWLMEGLARTLTPRLPEPGAESDTADSWDPGPGLTWVHYDLELDSGPLAALGLTPDAATIQRLRLPGRTQDLSQLKEAGARAASAQVLEAHFPRVFDPALPRPGQRSYRASQTQAGPTTKRRSAPRPQKRSNVKK